MKGKRYATEEQVSPFAIRSVEVKLRLLLLKFILQSKACSPHLNCASYA